jgi:Fe-S cluster biogenesis protein NfuA
MDECKEESKSEWKRIESLIGSLDSYPDVAIRDNVRELVGSLLLLHGEAIAHLLEAFDEPSLKELASQPAISSVLLLHGLHPDDVQTRIERALEQVRPSLRSHQGDVELLAIEQGRVRLRLVGTCNGCPSSTVTFKNLLETAIQDLAPEIESIEVDGMSPGRAA